MYSVSSAFRAAMNNPVQEHKITGAIGSVSFDESNIVDGSFSISNQSTDTNDVVLGSCYVGELTAEFTGLSIGWSSWIGKVITPSFGLKVGNSWETVPLGIFKISKATHTAFGVQVTAYDYMTKFDKKFKKSHFMNLAGMYNIINQMCTDCGVTLGMTQAQIEALPNGDRTGINIYGSKGKKSEFANDITTNRDLLFWVAQTLGCFATMDRSGHLVFRKYSQNVVDVISNEHRLEGATFEDYITHYIGIYVENLDDNTEDYYGYDTAALQAELTETNSEISSDREDITELNADLVEWAEKLAQGQCTQEEYDAAVAEINAQIKAKQKDIKQLTKRVSWLEKAIQSSADDGSDMVLGANPLCMAANKTTRDAQRREILGALDDISYTPFTASVVCGCIYDLGDVIQFSGGLYNSDTDSFGCVMAYTYTHNGGTELQGFGVDPQIVMIRNKTQKSADRAERNTNNATHNNTGFESYIDPDYPPSSDVQNKDGNIHIVTTPPIKIERHINNSPFWYATRLAQGSNGKYSITVTGYSDPAITPFSSINAAIFKAIGFGGAGTYHIKCKMQLTGYSGGNAWGCNNLGLYISYDDTGIYFGGTLTYGTLSTTPVDTFLLNTYYDNDEHEYSFDFVIDDAHAGYIVNKTMYIAVVMDRCWKYGEPMASGTLNVTDLEITGENVVSSKDVVGLEVNVDGTWKNVDYVNNVSQTQSSTGGTEIAEIQNTNGTKTKIYQKTVDANPTGTATGELKSLTIGDTVYRIEGNVKDVKSDNTSIVDSNGIANINTMTGATAQADGAKGLVPAPLVADKDKVLYGSGEWKNLPESAISTLVDVALSNLADNDILKYNGVTQKWNNGKRLYYEQTDPSNNVGTDGDFWVKYELVPTDDWTADDGYILTAGGNNWESAANFAQTRGGYSFYKTNTGKAVVIFQVGTSSPKWSGPVLLTRDDPTYVYYYRGGNRVDCTSYSTVTVDGEIYYISEPGVWITDDTNTKTAAFTAVNVTDQELGYPSTLAEKAAAIIEKANVRTIYEPNILAMWVKAGGKWQPLMGGSSYVSPIFVDEQGYISIDYDLIRRED